MVLGYAAFYGSRKAVGSTPWRKNLLIASNVIYSAGLLLLMIIDNIVTITGISLVVMFVLGYVGGAVYYFLSLIVSENPHGGRIIGLGGALAYILHYVLWALLKQEVIMIVVLLTLFVFVTYIVIRNPKEWATSDQGAKLLLLIPLVSGITSLLTGLITFVRQKRTNPEMAKNPTSGCMTFAMPLMSVYFTFLFPAGIGLYWIFQNILSAIQMVILNHVYSNEKVMARMMVAETIQRRSKENNDKFISRNK